jgi:hypothetical protein
MIKSRRMRWTGHVTQMGEKKKAYRILVERPEGKILLRIPGYRWVDNIKMNLREIRWDGMDWTELAQDIDQWRTLVNTVMNLWDPQNIWKFLSSCTTGGFSRRAQLQDVSYV